MFVLFYSYLSSATFLHYIAISQKIIHGFASVWKVKQADMQKVHYYLYLSNHLCWEMVNSDSLVKCEWSLNPTQTGEIASRHSVDVCVFNVQAGVVSVHSQVSQRAPHATTHHTEHQASTKLRSVHIAAGWEGWSFRVLDEYWPAHQTLRSHSWSKKRRRKRELNKMGRCADDEDTINTGVNISLPTTYPNKLFK